MNRIAIALFVLSAAVVLMGCSTQPSLVTGDEPAVFLTEYGSTVPAGSDAQPRVYLGAGDALGQALFMNYVASLKGQEPADTVFAAGADPRPE